MKYTHLKTPIYYTIFNLRSDYVLSQEKHLVNKKKPTWWKPLALLHQSWPFQLATKSQKTSRAAHPGPAAECFPCPTIAASLVKRLPDCCATRSPFLPLAFIWPTWSLLNLKYDLISRSIARLNLIAALKCYFTPMAALGKGQIINIWPQFTSRNKKCAAAAAASTTNAGSRPCPFSDHKYLV